MFVFFSSLFGTDPSPFDQSPIRADQLQDYTGGTNQILIWLAVSIGIFLLTAGITWIIYQKWRYQQFFALCQEKGLSTAEYGLLSDFAKKFYEKDLLSLVTKKASFDKLISQIAHHYKGKNLCLETLEEENTLIQNIRSTLGFIHNYSEKKLLSTRALPINHPITVLLTDQQKRRTDIKFLSSIEYSNNFYIGITPPEQSIKNSLDEKARLPFLLSFIRENDAEYIFDSHLISVVDHPKQMWILAHNDKLQKGESQRRVELPGILTVADDDQEASVDYKIVIDQLARDGCQFHSKSQNFHLHPPFSGLISFSFNEKSETLRAQVNKTVRRGDQLYYRAQFKTIEKDQLLRLQRIVHALKARPEPIASLPKNMEKKGSKNGRNRIESL